MMNKTSAPFDPVIVAAVRSPVGRRNGTLKEMRADELLAHAIRSLVERSKISPALVEDVIAGCVTQIGEQGFNIGRTATLMSGLPQDVPGTTLSRQCGSSQQALHFAAMAVASGQQDVVIAAGVEAMSRVPMASDAAIGVQGVAPAIPFSQMLTDHYQLVTQHDAAERVAEKWGISRKACEEFSLESHRRAASARENGRFRDEIAPIMVDGAVFDRDEGIRADSTLEKLASLATVIKPTGVVTAGTASQISDGSAALLVTSRKKADELGMKPRAKVLATQVVGVDPTMMLHGVIPATQKVLARAGLNLSDIDLFEVNEAFASVPLAWSKELGISLEKVNVNGGAIAIGHPLGASGARILTTLIHELEKRGARYGLATMCIGMGQATATILERL